MQFSFLVLKIVLFDIDSSSPCEFFHDGFDWTLQLTLRQNAWNDVCCSDKCGESMLCQTLHVHLDSETQNIYM